MSTCIYFFSITEYWKFSFLLSFLSSFLYTFSSFSLVIIDLFILSFRSTLALSYLGRPVRSSDTLQARKYIKYFLLTSVVIHDWKICFCSLYGKFKRFIIIPNAEIIYLLWVTASLEVETVEYNQAVLNGIFKIKKALNEFCKQVMIASTKSADKKSKPSFSGINI